MYKAWASSSANMTLLKGQSPTNYKWNEYLNITPASMKLTSILNPRHILKVKLLNKLGCFSMKSMEYINFKICYLRADTVLFCDILYNQI